MKNLSTLCAMLVLTAWATNAQNKIAVTEVTTNMTPYERNDTTFSVNLVNDGDYSTFFWANTAQKAGDYIQVDLGSTQSIGNITITFHDGGLDKPTPAEIQYQDENGEWQKAGDVDVSGSSYSCSANGANAQYVRLYIKANSGFWPRLAEFEVFTPDPNQTRMPVLANAGTVFLTGADAKITITSEAGATIYYTLDGSEPSTTSASITSGGQITLDTNQPWQTTIAVRAMAQAAGKSASLMASATYYVHDYCMPIYSGNTVGGIETLSITGTDVNVNSNGFGDNVIGVGGFTADLFTAEAGTELTLSLTTKNNKWGNVRVYVDLDGSKMLDSDENVLRIGDYSAGETDSIKTGNTTFTISETAPQGTYLMRVFFVASANETESASASPCAVLTEGGYYDFAFNVTNSTSGLSLVREASSLRAVVSGNSLRVSGVPAGETIRVYTVNSVLVASAVATQGVTELAVPAQGVLIVRAGNEVTKVIK